MKVLNHIPFLIFLFLSTGIYAQKAEIQKADFKVWGNCDMCKKNIEKAAKSLDGVEMAKWNVVTKKMKIKFQPEKLSIEEIKQAISIAGYDTEELKASDEAYNALHHCCKYERDLKNK